MTTSWSTFHELNERFLPVLTRRTLKICCLRKLPISVTVVGLPMQVLSVMIGLQMTSKADATETEMACGGHALGGDHSFPEAWPQWSEMHDFEGDHTHVYTVCTFIYLFFYLDTKTILSNTNQVQTFRSSSPSAKLQSKHREWPTPIFVHVYSLFKEDTTNILFQNVFMNRGKCKTRKDTANNKNNEALYSLIVLSWRLVYVGPSHAP